MDLQLQGKTALVTGATKGIGRAIIELLSDEGCNIAFCARNEAEVTSTVEAISAKGVSVCGRVVALLRPHIRAAQPHRPARRPARFRTLTRMTFAPRDHHVARSPPRKLRSGLVGCCQMLPGWLCTIWNATR